MAKTKVKTKQKRTQTLPRTAHVTLDQWKIMLNTFAETRSIEQSAQAAGVSITTATRYIYSGTETQMSIREIVDQRTKDAFAKADDELGEALLKVAKNARITQITALQTVLVTLNKARVKLKGETDADGNVHTSAMQYKTLVESASKVLRITEDIAVLLSSLQSIDTVGNAASVTQTLQTRSILELQSATVALLQESDITPGSEQEAKYVNTLKKLVAPTQVVDKSSTDSSNSNTH